MGCMLPPNRSHGHPIRLAQQRTAACGRQQAQPNMAPIRRDSCDNDNQEAEEGDLRYLNSDDHFWNRK